MPGVTDWIFELITKHLDGTLSTEEQGELDQWVNESPVNREAVEEFLKEETLLTGISAMYKWRDKVWDNLQEKMDSEKVMPMHRKPWWKYGAAAAIILLVGFGTYFFIHSSKQQTPSVAQGQITKDIEAPKETRAVITLADGSKVYLDSAGNGTLAQQSNVNVVKNEKGEIVYQTLATNNAPLTVYNTIFNPRGSKVVSLVLSDGTKVWLNSESSLKYPTAFTTNTREVEITGEAYFEVTHDASKPFHVKKGHTDVTVLGTHFNVNAYDDEDALRVTLLEGSVKVSANNNSKLIKPGQQARAVNGELSVVNDVDLDKVMAWKDGWFEFSSSELTTIMRELSRWYDLDVHFEGTPTNEKYVGRINKNLPLSNVLHLLESNGVKFRVDGKKVIVTP